MTQPGKIDLPFVRLSYTHRDMVEAYAAKAHRTRQRNVGLPSFLQGLFDAYLPKNERMLDAGCAAGEMAHGMARMGYWEVVGVDLSSEMIAAARSISPGDQPSPSFHVGDLTQLAFPDQCFDGAIALHAITPIPTRELRQKALCELHRMLRPGSVLIISTFLQEDPAFAAFWKEEAIRWRTGKHDPRLHELGDRIDEKAGFFLHVPKEADFRAQLQVCGYNLLDAGWWHHFSDLDEDCDVARKCFYWIVMKGTEMSRFIMFRQATAADSEFAYQTKKAAFRTYVEQVCGLDEVEQRRMHDRRFAEQEFQVLQVSGADVGILAWVREESCVKVNQLFILPEYQGRGIGGECMKRVIANAEREGLAVRLRVLNVNTRAVSFYRRLGFQETGQTETHIEMCHR